jgi:hypothetical protein
VRPVRDELKLTEVIAKEDRIMDLTKEKCDENHGEKV